MALKLNGDGSVQKDAETALDLTKVSQGIAKAWANINGTSTPAALRDAFNISSLNDEATGVYGLNLSVAVGNSSYSCVAAASKNVDDTTTSGAALSALPSQVARTASYQRILTGYSAMTYADAPAVNASIFGD